MGAMTRRFPRYDRTDADGAARKIRTFESDPITMRYGVRVDGVVVGIGYATADDALDRGVEFVREGR